MDLSQKGGATQKRLGTTALGGHHGGGGLKLLAGHIYLFIYFTREMESFIFLPQDRLYFHQALWPFIYFTHFPTKIFIFKRSPPPPPPKILRPIVHKLLLNAACPFTNRWTSLAMFKLSQSSSIPPQHGAVTPSPRHPTSRDPADGGLQPTRAHTSGTQATPTRTCPLKPDFIKPTLAISHLTVYRYQK